MLHLLFWTREQLPWHRQELPWLIVTHQSQIRAHAGKHKLTAGTGEGCSSRNWCSGLIASWVLDRHAHASLAADAEDDVVWQFCQLLQKLWARSAKDWL